MLFRTVLHFVGPLLYTTAERTGAFWPVCEHRLDRSPSHLRIPPLPRGQLPALPCSSALQVATAVLKLYRTVRKDCHLLLASLARTRIHQSPQHAPLAVRGVWSACDRGVFSVGEGPAFEPWKDWQETKIAHLR